MGRGRPAQDLLALLVERRRAGRSVVRCGAPGRSSTLPNYYGTRTDLLDDTIDRNPYKRGTSTARYADSGAGSFEYRHHAFALRTDPAVKNLHDGLIERLACVRE